MQQLKAKMDFRHPETGKMVRAGDHIEMTTNSAGLYRRLGAITSLARPDADGSGNIIRSVPVLPRISKGEKVAISKTRKRKAAAKKAKL